MKLDDAIAKLLVARKRLDPEQGRIARRNARSAALVALNAVRKSLDEEFPPIAKPRRVTVSMKKDAVARRINSKLRRDHVLIDLPTVIRLHDCGVRTVRRPGNRPGDAEQHYGPRWAVRALRAGVATEAVSKAVRSQKERRKIESLVRLGGS